MFKFIKSIFGKQNTAEKGPSTAEFYETLENTKELLVRFEQQSKENIELAQKIQLVMEENNRLKAENKQLRDENSLVKELSAEPVESTVEKPCTKKIFPQPCLNIDLISNEIRQWIDMLVLKGIALEDVEQHYSKVTDEVVDGVRQVTLVVRKIEESDWGLGSIRVEVENGEALSKGTIYKQDIISGDNWSVIWHKIN